MQNSYKKLIAGLPGTHELFRQPALPGARVRFRDLAVTDVSVRQLLLNAVEEVLISGQLLMGPKVELFEKAMADYCGRQYCVGVSSGTDAVYLALRALGIGAGDEVITTSLSWVATLNAIVMTGAVPVIVDIARDQNIDPDKIEAAITNRTKVVLPVHFTGRLCDMTTIRHIADRHDLLVIEDAAQAMGARTETYRAGGLGDAAAFSFNPMKVFPGYGEAGAVVTDDASVDARLRELRYLGTKEKEVCVELSLNAKMDEIQAAMLLPGFDLLDGLIDKRIALARAYSEKLAGTVECPPPPEPGDYTSNFFDYQIYAPDRDGLRAHLAEKGVETKVKHPVLLPDHPAFSHLARPDIPVAEYIAGHMLSIPLHEKMTDEDVDYVVDAIQEYCR